MLECLFIGNPDGGIINSFAQVPQSEEPVVVIGLGGTGIDAITRLKRKLYEQIEPDNKEEVRDIGVKPKYRHIKFLGIDVDRKWLENSCLTQDEQLNIVNGNDEFSSGKIQFLKNKKNFSG